jgi:hypothetical protein
VGFFEDASADAAEIVAELGQDVTYTPNGATPRGVKGLWSPSSRDAKRARGMQNDRGVLQLHEDDAPAPDTRDAFAIDGVDYSVEGIGASRPLVTFRVVAINQNSDPATT